MNDARFALFEDLRIAQSRLSRFLDTCPTWDGPGGPARPAPRPSGGPIDSLTERETEVLYELAHGRTNREIGEVLRVSEETVKSHVASILGKLQLGHRTQAVIYALKRGLLSLDRIELPSPRGG